MNTLTPIAIGELAKFSLAIDPIDGLTPIDYDFKVRLFVDERRFVELTKSDIVVEGDSLVFYVDTRAIGTGIVLARIIADIPDSNAPDQSRRMEAVVATNAYIYR